MRALGVDPEASRLFAQGGHDKWVDYPTGQILDEPGQTW